MKKPTNLTIIGCHCYGLWGKKLVGLFEEGYRVARRPCCELSEWNNLFMNETFCTKLTSFVSFAIFHFWHLQSLPLHFLHVLNKSSSMVVHTLFLPITFYWTPTFFIIPLAHVFFATQITYSRSGGDVWTSSNGINGL